MAATGPGMVLCYHSLDRSDSVISVAPEVFQWQMQCLAVSGRPVVPLAKVAEIPGSVAITFDDGFRNFFQSALPILREHAFPATVFVVTGHCGGHNNWSSQPPGVPTFDLMDWDEIGEAARCGITLGAHTVTHPKLTGLAAPEVLKEMRGSRDEIENRLNQTVETFAYPYGDHNAKVRQTAQSCFRVSCGTSLDFMRPHHSLDNLARLDVFYLRDPAVFQKVVVGKGERYIFARRSLRKLRRWMVH